MPNPSRPRAAALTATLLLLSSAVLAGCSDSSKDAKDEDIMFARPGPAVEYWEDEE